MYPSTKLPLLLGAFQFKLICDEDTALAVRPVGVGSTGIIGLSVIGCTNVEVADVSPEVVVVSEFAIGIRSPDAGDINALDEDNKRNPKNSAVIIFVLLSIFFP
jgi:hypothetical protein